MIHWCLSSRLGRAVSGPLSQGPLGPHGILAHKWWQSQTDINWQSGVPSKTLYNQEWQQQSFYCGAKIMSPWQHVMSLGWLIRVQISCHGRPRGGRNGSTSMSHYMHNRCAAISDCNRHHKERSLPTLAHYPLALDQLHGWLTLLNAFIAFEINKYLDMFSVKSRGRPDDNYLNEEFSGFV